MLLACSTSFSFVAAATYGSDVVFIAIAATCTEIYSARRISLHHRCLSSRALCTQQVLLHSVLQGVRYSRSTRSVIQGYYYASFVVVLRLTTSIKM